MGTLSILNVYEGDVKITFDTTNAAEAIRAGRIITDMLRRGYALLIEVDGAYQRAIDFDEKVGEYVIADFDPSYRQTTKGEGSDNEEENEEIEAAAAQEAPGKRRGRRRRISMDAADAVAVARSAGG